MHALVALLALLGLAAAVPTPAGAQAPHFVQTWGTIGSAAGQFQAPFGVAYSPSGRLYVCDQFNFRIQYFSSTGDYLGSFAHTDPYNIAVGPDGSVYLSAINRVRRVTADGEFIQEWGGAFIGIVGLAVEPDGDVLVVDPAGQRIVRYTSDGQFLDQIQGGIALGTTVPITVNDLGEIFVGGLVDSTGTTYTILKFSAEGEEIGTIVPSISMGIPAGLAVDKQGNLYAVDPFNNRVLMFSSSGATIATWGTFGSAPGQFKTPACVAVDGAGRVFISDLANHRIQVFGDETPATPSTWGRLKADYR